MYDIEWKLNVAESLVELDVRLQTIIKILVDKEIVKVEDFMERLEEIKTLEVYKTEFENIKKAREELEKPLDLANIFSGFLSKDAED